MLLLLILCAIIIMNNYVSRVYTDNNVDDTAYCLKEWCDKASLVYRHVYYFEDKEPSTANYSLFEWHEERIIHMCHIRQKALEDARKEADYLFVILSLLIEIIFCVVCRL